MIKIEIDEGSGFCFGVTTAIRKAEEELAGGGTLYCLGDIVHNGSECDRLKRLGLITIDHTAFSSLSEGKVLLRAHGEPPSTYASAAARGIRLVDATCPVVLRLQRLIGRTYAEPSGPQVVIYGKPGHAEVLGLVGQTEGTAIVVQSPEEAERLDFRPHSPLKAFARFQSSLRPTSSRRPLFAPSTPSAGRCVAVCPAYAVLPRATTSSFSSAD